MPVNAEAFKRAAYPRSLRESKPRIALVRWNNAKSRRGGEDRFSWRECWIVKFPNGRIVTDFGPCYETMGDMCAQLERQGSVEVRWQDEMEQEETSCR